MSSIKGLNLFSRSINTAESIAKSNGNESIDPITENTAKGETLVSRQGELESTQKSGADMSAMMASRGVNLHKGPIESKKSQIAKQLEAIHLLSTQFANIDKNKDGVLSAPELKAFLSNSNVSESVGNTILHHAHELIFATIQPEKQAWYGLSKKDLAAIEGAMKKKKVTIPEIGSHLRAAYAKKRHYPKDFQGFKNFVNKKAQEMGGPSFNVGPIVKNPQVQKIQPSQPLQPNTTTTDGNGNTYTTIGGSKVVQITGPLSLAKNTPVANNREQRDVSINKAELSAAAAANSPTVTVSIGPNGQLKVTGLPENSPLIHKMDGNTVAIYDPAAGPGAPASVYVINKGSVEQYTTNLRANETPAQLSSRVLTQAKALDSTFALGIQATANTPYINAFQKISADFASIDKDPGSAGFLTAPELKTYLTQQVTAGTIPQDVANKIMDNHSALIFAMVQSGTEAWFGFGQTDITGVGQDVYGQGQGIIARLQNGTSIDQIGTDLRNWVKNFGGYNGYMGQTVDPTSPATFTNYVNSVARALGNTASYFTNSTPAQLIAVLNGANTNSDATISKAELQAAIDKIKTSNNPNFYNLDRELLQSLVNNYDRLTNNGQATHPLFQKDQLTNYVNTQVVGSDGKVELSKINTIPPGSGTPTKVDTTLFTSVLTQSDGNGDGVITKSELQGRRGQVTDPTQQAILDSLIANIDRLTYNGLLQNHPLFQTNTASQYVQQNIANLDGNPADVNLSDINTLAAPAIDTTKVSTGAFSQVLFSADGNNDGTVSKGELQARKQAMAGNPLAQAILDKLIANIDRMTINGKAPDHPLFKLSEATAAINYIANKDGTLADINLNDLDTIPVLRGQVQDVISRIRAGSLPSDALAGANLSMGSGFYSGGGYLDSLDFNGLNLTGTKFDGTVITEANFSNANLTNSSFKNVAPELIQGLPGPKFEGANLTGADFTGAQLGYQDGGPGLYSANFKNATLTNVNFTNANLRSAEMTGSTANGAKFNGATITRTFMPSSLNAADFTSSNLTQASFSNVNSMDNANFTNANMSNLWSWQSDFSKANLSGTNLSSAQFLNSNLSGRNLSSSNTSGTIFDTSNLTGVNLSGRNLGTSSFINSNLTNGNLSNATISSQTNFQNTDLQNANLTGINLNSVDLSTAKNVQSTQGGQITLDNFPGLRNRLNNHKFKDNIIYTPDGIPQLPALLDALDTLPANVSDDLQDPSVTLSGPEAFRIIVDPKAALPESGGVNWPQFRLDNYGYSSNTKTTLLINGTTPVSKSDIVHELGHALDFWSYNSDFPILGVSPPAPSWYSIENAGYKTAMKKDFIRFMSPPAINPDTLTDAQVDQRFNELITEITNLRPNFWQNTPLDANGHPVLDSNDMLQDVAAIRQLMVRRGQYNTAQLDALDQELTYHLKNFQGTLVWATNSPQSELFAEFVRYNQSPVPTDSVQQMKRQLFTSSMAFLNDYFGAGFPGL